MFDPDNCELQQAQKYACKMAKERDEARALADRLAAELAECTETLPGAYYMDQPHEGGDASVSEQLSRMAKDAERYRHLKREAMTVNAEALDKCDSTDHIIYVMAVNTKVKRVQVVYHGASIPDLDALIDAEIASKGRMMHSEWPEPVGWMTPGGDISRSLKWCTERCLPNDNRLEALYTRAQVEAMVCARRRQ